MTKQEILEELANLENHILLKSWLAGEDPTLKEIHRLNELRVQAYNYGYVHNHHMYENGVNVH